MASQDFFSPAKPKESKVLPPSIVNNGLSEASQNQALVKSNNLKLNIQDAQEIIYKFFIESVKTCTPDSVFHDFKNLFIDLILPVNSHVIQAIHTIVVLKNELEYKNLFKRCCYILLNNWVSQRQYQLSLELIQTITKEQSSQPPLDNPLRILKVWLINFVQSKDYQEIKLFISKYDPAQTHWTRRYTPFLLAPQYVDATNSEEHRQAAKIFSQQLKEQYKFELAMYTSRSQLPTFKDRLYHNPTLLGDEALNLIKVILVSRGSLSYPSLANIFIGQSQDISYKQFKQSLIQYLFYLSEKTVLINLIKNKIAGKLALLYQENDEETFNNNLLLRTCNYLIKYLTVENSGRPSSIFRIFYAQGNPLNLGIMLLKLVLISQNSRLHLEVCLGRLIYYYEDDKADECQWFINFLEICQISLTIYGDNVQYNLVNMSESQLTEEINGDLNNCRVFSQQKRKIKSDKSKEDGKEEGKGG
ncbi:MAG TPA: hypothetical protein VK211_29790 [Kamptonema sp.]|nr:hypothetical protein [Kamptonema sp.]